MREQLLKNLSAMMEKGVEIIKKRGKSTTGEKTMLDTFVHAVETLRKEYEGGTPAKEAMEKAVEAGKAGLESTRNIVATKGRAMRLGERAIGHLDPVLHLPQRFLKYSTRYALTNN